MQIKLKKSNCGKAGGVYISAKGELENDLDFILFSEKINFCPKCGRGI